MPTSSTGPMSRRPSLHTTPVPPTPSYEPYSDSRFHGLQGPPRHVRIPRVASYGGGATARSEDGHRCIVAGRESLRILRMSDPGTTSSSEHKCAIGRGGYRVDASRNLWTGSGLKIDSSSTDVIWGHGTYSNKIITSARNGEIIIWDVNKSGPSKVERRIKGHVRAINQIAYSTILPYYCVTASADGSIRVWDFRDMREAITQIRHPACVRSVALSPVSWQPLQAMTALDNGNMHMWDLMKGQQGQLHRIPLAHSGPVLTLDWTLPSSSVASGLTRSGGSAPTSQTNWYGNMGSGLFDDLGSLSGGSNTAAEGETAGMGWLASGGIDRCVKIWNLNTQNGESQISRQPVYTLHTSYPIRRVLWRPGYECELAVVSNFDFDAGAKSCRVDSAGETPAGSPQPERDAEQSQAVENKAEQTSRAAGDPIEIWDVRRRYVAKWTVRGSAVEGGVTDIAFSGSHTIWAQHFSGAFSQLDLRFCSRPLDAVPRTAVAWDACGGLAFVSSKNKRWEIPYDDLVFIRSPEKKGSVKRKGKSLGDGPFLPTSQTVGMVSGHGLVEDIETVVKLAHGYVFEGSDKAIICSRNADVAASVGKYSAIQVWQLLMSLLIDITPPEDSTPIPTRSLSPLAISNPRLPHISSAPASIPMVNHPGGNSTNLAHPVRSISETLHGPTHGRDSPGAGSTGSGPHSRDREEKYKIHHASLSISGNGVGGTGYLSPPRNTPVSSTTTSPHRPTSPLPQASSSMVSSTLFRRPSSSGMPMSLNLGPSPVRPRLSSSSMSPSIRRPSFSTTGMPSLSESASDLRSSYGSLRHVGDGALDDSDSEGSDDGNSQSVSRQERDEVESDGDQDVLARTPSDRRRSSFYRAMGYSRPNSVQPSPLSQIAGQHVSEDEKEEEDTPSPASTDSESVSSDEHAREHSQQPSSSRLGASASRSRRSSTKSTKSKGRSRSSTVASLAASIAMSTTSSHGKLVKHESQSSIRTVTATPTPTSAHTPETQHDTSRETGTYGTYIAPGRLASRVDSGGSTRSLSYYSHSRPRSEDPLNDINGDPERKTSESSAARGTRIAQRENVRQSEARLREAGWQAMRETLEVFADEGDVQMCAMLAVIAPDELRIGSRRVLRFLESYIELLMRLRLHAIAAYVRKHATVEDVRNSTSMETTIYTCCGRCRKPLLHPVGRPTHAGRLSGSYAFCANCKASSTLCSICHLPVRALLFQCPVCLHGGHRTCYQQYYLRRPLQELSLPVQTQQSTDTHRSTPTTPESKFRGRAISRSVDGDGSDDNLSNRDGEDGRHRGNELTIVEGGNAILGHPCAAGCGHYCWAANEALLLSAPDAGIRFT